MRNFAEGISKDKLPDDQESLTRALDLLIPF